MFSSKIIATTTPQQLGTETIEAEVDVENIAAMTDVWLWTGEGTPSGATVTGEGQRVEPAGGKERISVAGGVDLSTYWIATSAGTAECRIRA